MDTPEEIRESRVIVALGTETAPTLIHWATAVRPGGGGTYDSYALRAREGWVAIDPIEPDHMFEEGSAAERQLPGGMRAKRVAGLWGGDHVLGWEAPTGEGVLFTGDPVNGQIQLELAAPDHFRRPNALNFGARPGYVERHPDPGALKRSLERLLEWEFDVLCGSHATPFRENPKAALAELLASI